MMTMMVSHKDALWTKLHELELQLAAYKLQRGEDVEGVDASFWATEATCRGRQYEAYMRRRDARREAASAEQQTVKAKKPQTRGMGAAGGSKPMSTRALGCTARDAHDHEVKRTSTVPIPSTPRRDTGALPRSRTVSGATGSPATRSHHQRRSSLGGAPIDFGDSGAATPRPFLKRGTGTGGAAAPARLRAPPPRVHDLPPIDVPVITPRQPQPERGHAHAPVHAARHVRSASELPFDTAAAALASAPQTPPRARKRWGSPERPAALFSAPAANSHRDFSQGLKRLLSFVRKGGNKADVDTSCAAVRSTGGKNGKPVSKGWSREVAACSLLDVPFDDRANLDGHRFPATRTVGISS